jgi:hypothetical protein
MRSFLLILVFVTMLLSSCKKDSIANDLVGTWELERTITMTGITNYAAGNGTLLIFYSNHKFESQSLTIPSISGLYKVSSKKDCYPRSDDDLLTLHFDGSNSSENIAIENGKLSLSTSNCIADGGTAIYRKL